LFAAPPAHFSTRKTAKQSAGNTDLDYAQISDEEVEQAREDMVQTKGFFMRPSELFENVLKRAGQLVCGDTHS